MLENHQSNLGDIEFFTLINLRRLPFDTEKWRDGDFLAAKLALRYIVEFLAINLPDDCLIDPSTDCVVAFDRTVIERAFTLALGRMPRSEEEEAVCVSGGISLLRLSARTLSSYESCAADGLIEQASPASFYARRTIAALVQNYDLRSRCFLSDVRQGSLERRQLHGMPVEKLRVAINLFTMSDEATAAVVDNVRAMTGYGIEIIATSSPAVIENNALEGVDLYLTNNNYLYQDTDRHLAAIKKSGTLSVCWLWDNHHQYDLSSRAASAFDLVVPAHSNGQVYLRGKKAIVAPIVPCCMFQWQPEEAETFFERSHDLAPHNSLYGRFNSYPGRLSLRDSFLHQVAASVSPNVAVINHADNDWANRSSDERFLQVAAHKAVLCNPIFNDLPCRVFDALLCGSIPILPYGLPDTSTIFAFSDMEEAGIVQYVENDLESLRWAVARAIAIYDRQGSEGRRSRHRLVMRHHLLQHRICRILCEALRVRVLFQGGPER